MAQTPHPNQVTPTGGPYWVTGVQSPDLTVENHGTIFLFRPESDAGRDWLAENTDPDAPWFGDALAVEHRYAHDLATAASNDGLVVV